jgi:hypothetical protein
MPSDASVLGLKRSSLDEEPSAQLKRARAVAEEPEEDPSVADAFVERLVFGIRASSNSGEARNFAETQLRPLLAKTQRQTEATRVLFRALTNLQTKMARHSEIEAEKLKAAEDRASAAERRVHTLLWQLRSTSSGNSFLGPDPGVF